MSQREVLNMLSIKIYCLKIFIKELTTPMFLILQTKTFLGTILLTAFKRTIT